MNKYNLGNVKFFIDQTTGIFYTQRYDDLTKEGVYAEWNDMQQIEGFDSSCDSIADYSLVPCVDLNVSDVLEVNKNIPSLDVRTGNIAIVAGLQPGRHMLARFFCTIVNRVSSRKHQVFHTRTEAELWLLSVRESK